MAEFFIYQKKRREFGKPCNFSDTKGEFVGIFLSGYPQENTHKLRDPNFITFDNIAELSEH